MIVSAWRWGLSCPTRHCAVARRIVRPSIVQCATLVHQLLCTWTVSSSLHDQCHARSGRSAVQAKTFRSWILAFTLSMVSKPSIPPTGTGSLFYHRWLRRHRRSCRWWAHRTDTCCSVCAGHASSKQLCFGFPEDVSALCLATTKYPRTLPEQLTAVAELLTEQQPDDVPVLHDARTIQQVTRVEFQILEQPEFELATLTPLRWVHIFSRRLSLWQQQQQQRQPHPAVPPVFLAVFADQVAAGHVQGFTLLFSFHSQSDGRNSLVCVSSSVGTAERSCRAVNSSQRSASDLLRSARGSCAARHINSSCC